MILMGRSWAHGHCQSIHISKFYLILFYHLKKLFYQLYHTILQYTQHLKTLIFFPFYLNILFYSSFYYISFSLPFLLFLPQPLAPATIDKTKTVQHTIIPITTTPPPCHHQHIVTPHILAPPIGPSNQNQNHISKKNKIKKIKNQSKHQFKPSQNPTVGATIKPSQKKKITIKPSHTTETYLCHHNSNTPNVTPQPNFIINLWVYMHVIVLIIFKCMKL